MIFGAEIRPHSPPQKVFIFPLFFKEKFPLKTKTKQRLAKLNVFCLKQDKLNNILLKFAYTI